MDYRCPVFVTGPVHQAEPAARPWRAESESHPERALGCRSGRQGARVSAVNGTGNFVERIALTEPLTFGRLTILG